MDKFCHDYSPVNETIVKGEQTTKENHEYLARNTLPFSWLRYFFHSFNATGRFWVKLHDTEETSRGIVSVLPLKQPNTQDASPATVLDATHNHGYSPQSFQTIPPAWFIPMGPPDCPPIFTVGLGLGLGREEIDMLIKFGQQADWLFAPTCIPSGIPVKLFHAIIYQTVLFSPKRTSLEREELDQLRVPLQHSWLEQCVQATRVINIEENNLARLSESPGVKTESVFELYSRMAQYISKYVTLGTVCNTRELNAIVLLCLQLLLQTAIRRLSDFRRTSLGGRRTTNRQNSSMSNLTTTMTSYNSLASTSTSASCETVASNFPLKPEMMCVLTDKLRNSASIDETNPIQIISVHLPESPKKELDRSHAQSECIAAVGRISPTVMNTLLAPKFLGASRKPQEIRSGDEKSDLPSIWIKSVVDRRDGVTRKTLGTSPCRWGSSGNLICGLQKLSDQNFRVELQQTSRTFVRSLSQSSPDIRVQTPLLFARSADSVSPLKTTTDVSDATKHSVVIRPIQADLCNKYSYSADHTYTSLSYDFTLDPGVPAVRDYLRRKLLSRILVEITTRLGSTQAEVVQLLPAFHEANLMKLVDDVIDQAVAITLTYRMNQLTNSYPSVPLSHLVTSSPVSVGLVMDKLLLDNLAETETTEFTIPTFPSCSHLHRHTTNLIDELIQTNEPLRTNPRMNQIRPDIIQTVLVLLWHSSYPAACIAMNQLLSENTNLGVIPNKSDTINSAPIPASSSDPPLYNDMWTTKISNVPCNIPLVKTQSSFADSRLTRIRTDGFGEPIIVTPRVPEIGQLATDPARHEEVSNSDLHSHSPGPVLDVSDVECVSPLPIVSDIGQVECGVTHYLSVQSSRSDSMQSKSPMNVADPSVLNEQVRFNGDMVRWRPKCLKFRLHGTTTEYNAAIITEQQTTPTETMRRQTVQTVTSLWPTMAFGSSNHTDKPVLFCPGCTKLIQTYWSTYGCVPENKETHQNGEGKDVSVQWSSADAVGKRQIITAVETNRCKSMAANDHHFSVGRRSLSQTPRVRDSEETRMVLEYTITRGRSRSQGTADESMSAQSVLYHSMSLSMRDHQPEHCTSPLAELLGPESLTEKVMSIKHSQRIGTNGNKKQLNKCFDSTEIEQSLYGKSDHTKGWSQVDGTRKSPGIASGNAGSPDKAVKPWIPKASKPLFSGYTIRPDSQDTGTRPISTSNNVLSVTPFYSCLRELRDCLSRAESRLNVAFCNYLSIHSHRRCTQPRGDMRGRSVEQPKDVLPKMRKNSADSSKLSGSNGPIGNCLSRALLGKPRSQTVTPRKHCCQSKVRPRKSQPIGSMKHRTKFEYSKAQTPSLNAGDDVRWAAGESRPRVPNMFPSPNMELPVKANVINPSDTKHLLVLGKLTGHRDASNHGIDWPGESKGGTTAQLVSSQTGRIGSILLKNVPRSRRRLNKLQGQASA